MVCFIFKLAYIIFIYALSVQPRLSGSVEIVGRLIFIYTLSVLPAFKSVEIVGRIWNLLATFR